MGHTVSSQRRQTDIIISELREYAKSLRYDERIIFEDLISEIYPKMGSISYAGSFHTWVFILFSIILSQEKKIRKLK